MEEKVLGSDFEDKTEEFYVDTSIDSLGIVRSVNKRKRYGRIIIIIGVFNIVLLSVLALNLLNNIHELQPELDRLDEDDDEDMSGGMLDWLTGVSLAFEIAVMRVMTFFAFFFMIPFVLLIVMGNLIEKGRRRSLIKKMSAIVLPFIVLMFALSFPVIINRYDNGPGNIFIMFVLLAFSLIVTFGFILFTLWKAKKLASTFEKEPAIPSLAAGKYLKSIGVGPLARAGAPLLEEEIERLKEQYKVNYVAIGKRAVRSSIALIAFLILTSLIAIPTFPYWIGSWKDRSFEMSDLIDISHFGPFEITMYIFLIGLAASAVLSVLINKKGRAISCLDDRINPKAIKLELVFAAIFLVPCSIPLFLLAIRVEVYVLVLVLGVLLVVVMLLQYSMAPIKKLNVISNLLISQNVEGPILTV